jgi:predicted GNAT family acetyltransferase
MTGDVVVERFATAHDFSAASTAFLVAREAENNLVLGITADLLGAGAGFGPDAPYFALAKRTGEVTAAALRTPPYNLVISATEDLEAMDLLARDLKEIYPVLPGLLAPVAAANRFADAWESLTSQRRRVRANERIHKCNRVMRARSPRGAMRAFREGDRETAVQWSKLFMRESKLPHPGGEAELRTAIDRRLKSRDGGVFFWEVDGELVSMAGAGGRTPNGVRIGPVYTPPSLRGKGYATALVADVTSMLLDRGLDFCFLFTDLANPTSNSIYAQIGYVPVTDCIMYDLES